MILILEIQRVYDEVFKTEEDRASHKLIKGALCDDETTDKLREFIKGADTETLTNLSTMDFVSWNELKEAMKDMKSFPGAFFIKEVK